MGRLSTHVLDTARGCPAAGLKIELTKLRPDGAREVVVIAVTNDDGRTDSPLLSAQRIPTGTYELAFHVGDYLRALGITLPDPPFLDLVPVWFGIFDGEANYHVPLLVSPHGYTTYRGS
jgi:5-hydroxyisourate hydrolase